MTDNIETQVAIGRQLALELLQSLAQSNYTVAAIQIALVEQLETLFALTGESSETIEVNMRNIRNLIIFRYETAPILYAVKKEDI